MVEEDLSGRLSELALCCWDMVVCWGEPRSSWFSSMDLSCESEDYGRDLLEVVGEGEERETYSGHGLCPSLVSGLFEWSVLIIEMSFGLWGESQVLLLFMFVEVHLAQGPHLYVHFIKY